MGTFLYLEESSGRRIFINADQIVKAIPEENDMCHIVLANEDAVVVRISLKCLTDLLIEHTVH
jgi:hypothetical protein